jgi:hypothetical protein
LSWHSGITDSLFFLPHPFPWLKGILALFTQSSVIRQQTFIILLYPAQTVIILLYPATNTHHCALSGNEPSTFFYMRQQTLIILLYPATNPQHSAQSRNNLSLFCSIP